MILRNANDSSQRLMDKAHNDVLKVNDEYEKVKQEFAKFRTKFRSFMNCQFEMFEGLENDYLKNYNVGNETRDAEIGEEAAIDLECSNLTLKNIDEKDLHNNDNNDLEEIKSFFAKE